MNIYDPIFSSSRTARAAGMGSVNFRAHLSRGNWSFFGNPLVETGARAALVSGQGHKFTIYDVMACALAKQLMDHGVEPSQAFQLGMEYGHFGVEGRDPGGVYDLAKGFTLYVYSLGAEKGKVVLHNEMATILEVFTPPDNNTRSTAIIINLNDLRRQVFESLGVDENQIDRNTGEGQDDDQV